MSCDDSERRYVRTGTGPGRSFAVVAGTGGDCHKADVERNFGLG